MVKGTRCPLCARRGAAQQRPPIDSGSEEYGHNNIQSMDETPRILRQSKSTPGHSRPRVSCSSNGETLAKSAFLEMSTEGTSGRLSGFPSRGPRDDEERSRQSLLNRQSISMTRSCVFLFFSFIPLLVTLLRVSRVDQPGRPKSVDHD